MLTGWSRYWRPPAGTSPSQSRHLSLSCSISTRSTTSPSLIPPSPSSQAIPTPFPGRWCPSPQTLGGFTFTYGWRLEMSSLHTDFAPPSWFIIWTWTTPAAPARTPLTTTTPPASTSGLQSLWAASPSGATTQGFPSAPTYRSITGESSKNDTYIFCLNTLKNLYISM